MFNPYFWGYPKFNPICEKPPTLYALLNSIANFGKDENERVKIKDLASATRTTIFDFSYPLSDHVDKEKFECLILNHYMMRRIGFDTPTAFKLALNVKLNSIMDIYNKMFDMLNGWDIFSDGEITERSITENGTSKMTSQGSDYSVNDNRESDTPQGELENVRDASYVTNYQYNQNNSNTNSATNGETENSTVETVTKSPADKMKLYREFIENRESIYNMIFKELDSLFYGLV